MCGSVRLKRVTALTGQSWRVRSRLMPRFLIMGFSLLSRAGLASLHRVACSLQLQTKLSPRTRTRKSDATPFFPSRSLFCRQAGRNRLQLYRGIRYRPNLSSRSPGPRLASLSYIESSSHRALSSLHPSGHRACCVELCLSSERSNAPTRKLASQCSRPIERVTRCDHLRTNRTPLRAFSPINIRKPYWYWSPRSTQTLTIRCKKVWTGENSGGGRPPRA